MAKREFKGIWIPKAIWLDKNLNITEKLLYAEIDSYDNDFGCVATNKTLCEDLQINPSTASGVIKNLERKGYLNVIYKDYNTFEGRVITINATPLAKSGGALAESQPPLAKSEPSNTFSNTLVEEGVLFPELYSGIQSEGEGTDKKEEVPPLYSKMIDIWFTEIHPDFVFSKIDGLKMKSVIKKTTTLLEKYNRPTRNEDVSGFFRMVCQNLPDFFKDKDLKTIDADFNQIIEKIKSTNNGTNKNTKPTSKYAPQR